MKSNLVSFKGKYWGGGGRFCEANALLNSHIPLKGKCLGSHNHRLETFRIMSNMYYDLYNNGGCNTDDREFRKLFGQPLLDELHQAYVNEIENALNKAIIAAIIEQRPSSWDDWLGLECELPPIVTNAHSFFTYAHTHEVSREARQTFMSYVQRLSTLLKIEPAASRRILDCKLGWFIGEHLFCSPPSHLGDIMSVITSSEAMNKQLQFCLNADDETFYGK